MRSHGHTLALCLPALLAVGVPRARADDTSPAPPGPVAADAPLLSAPPVIEQGAVRGTVVTLPSGPTVSLRASSGRFDAPVAEGATWTARYHPGEPVEPGAVLLHATRGGCGGSYAVVLRSTRAVHPIRTKPRSQITILVGERVAGQAVADARGQAVVTTDVMPGDSACEVRALDTLGNENRRTLRLPEPVAPPPLLALACAPSLEAGQSVLFEVAAADRLGRKAVAVVEAPPGVSIAVEREEALLTVYRATVATDKPAGRITVVVGNAGARATVEIDVRARPAISEGPPPPPPPPPSQPEAPSPFRPGLMLGADTGVASNLAQQWGSSSSVGVAFRPRALSGRLRPRLSLALDALWGGAATTEGTARVSALGTSVEAGLAATLLRSGAFEVDLEAGVGLGGARVNTVDAGAGSWRLLPSLALGLALRRHVGRGSLTARAAFRQRFRDATATAVEAADNHGVLGLMLGGELDL